ncbi:MAG: DegV family protein [Candidatus Dormibacteria bacterium]
MTRLVTDSTSDLPDAVAAELGITVVPLKVHFGSEEFRDRMDLDDQQFFEKLDGVTELPKTSQPSPGEFLEVYRNIPAGESIISVHLAEQLSGTYHSAQLAAQELPDRDIRVIDGGNVTAGLGLQVLAAADMIKAGRSADEIETELRGLYDRTQLLAILDTLKYAIMGGRVSRLQGTIGGMLRLKALMLVDRGVIHRLPPARTWSQAYQKIVEYIREKGGAERIGILDALAPESRVALRAELEKAFPDTPIFEAKLGAVIGTHAGPGAVGCAFIARKAG